MRSRKGAPTPLLWGPPFSTSLAPLEEDWLTLGSSSERNALTRYYNSRLEAGAKTCGYLYLSLFESLMNGQESRVDFSEDSIHIAQKHWPLWTALAQANGLEP
jgi:hypothetical protein